ncbi:glycerophosphoryl diester phosphodiesterase [Sporobacter termitidis DSM 10068]|uniref:Glycerophosphoryl diester phosphodiesterase n=1 Tax=Sporobacter termitidis DSM 10068 TaxID=1123282 RepID=A0A1M5VQT4_9FIRM|nr:glycerophosphodiester phosphodiesterase [Sporobacter termitidis]SHH77293.1 glycerophosphoryl diester phosphodiesterase [Sporobacter termitidis DSM 10068]
MRDYKILAHRGASAYAPENTMPAFELAVAQHADGFEIDIYFTRDGRIAVIHDDTINRTSDGKGAIAQYTLEELKAFNFNKGFESKYPLARIPSLEEVLDIVKKHNLILNIEIKDSLLNRSVSNGLGEAAAELVRKWDLTENVIFSSFNHIALVGLKKACPEVKTGLLYFENLYNAGQYALTAEAYALHPFFVNVSETMVSAAHEAGVVVNPYTINNPELMKLFRKFGVDGIITDCPDVCYDVRSGDAEGPDGGEEVLAALTQEYLQMITDYLSRDEK